MKKAIIFSILSLLVAIAPASAQTSSLIDVFADQVSSTDKGLLSIHMTRSDTITFKLSNAVEIDGHYYNMGEGNQCEFLLVFVLDQVWISDCEGNRYRSVRRCGRANCTMVHLECIAPDQSEHKDAMLFDGLNLGGR